MRRAVAVLMLASVCLVPSAADAADRTPPRTRITAGPTGPTRDPSPELRFKSSEKKSTFKCRIDSGRKRTCTSPYTTAHLADGPHTFAVFAIDRAGNKDESPAKRAFVVDTTAPDTVILTGPAQGSTVGAGASAFTFGSTESGSTFECQLDATGFAPCGPSTGYPGLGDGSHALSVRSCDQLGNCDPTPAARSWTVVTAPPGTTIDTGPAEGSTSGNNDQSFTFSADPALGAGFECRLDAGDFTACASPKQYVDLAEGGHTFTVRACGAGGSCDATPASRSWIVDTVPPHPTILTGPARPTTPDNRASFTFTASGDLASYQCTVDAGPAFACASGTSLVVTRNVVHSFRVQACDAVGNCELSSPWTWTVTDPAFIPVNESDEPQETDFCRLVFPATVSVTGGQSVTVYGRIYEDGVTPAPGVSSNVSFQVGYGPDGTDPRTAAGWTWVQGAANEAYGPGSPGYVANEDEYQGSFSAPAAAGSPYDYLVRFSLDAGNTATYCDVDGAGSAPGATFEPGAQSGQMTVS